VVSENQNIFAKGAGQDPNHQTPNHSVRCPSGRISQAIRPFNEYAKTNLKRSKSSSSFPRAREPITTRVADATNGDNFLRTTNARDWVAGSRSLGDGGVWPGRVLKVRHAWCGMPDDAMTPIAKMFTAQRNAAKYH
jgi:hypothetical protein